ncbi:MAG: FlgD immunoglobulin-like domain containing protein [Candidatus Omnitrophota bacterium]
MTRNSLIKNFALAFLFTTLIIYANPAYAANRSPAVGVITPDNGTSAPTQRVTFTTSYSDPDGASDISLAHLLINTTATPQNCFAAYYDNKLNKLYFANDKGVMVGGYTPGSSRTISNSYCKLECSKTVVAKTANTITVTWMVVFKRSFSGTIYDAYLKVNDKQNASTGWVKKGAWAVNFPPKVGTLSPSRGTSVPGQEIIISSKYRDRDKGDNIKLAYLLINTSTECRNCPAVYYDNSANKLYMLNDQGDTSVGGFAPGSSNIIENSYCKLNCSATQVTKFSTNMTVKWDVTFKHLFAGKTYDVYLKAVDKTDSSTGWVKKGVRMVKVTDTVAPVGKVVINSGAEYTNTAATNLKLSAQDNSGGSGLSQMRFSNDDVNWSSPEAYATTKTWMLSSGDGNKTVYVKFSDLAGNWSSAYSDSIKLDTIPPRVIITSPQDGAIVTVPDLTVSYTSDGVSKTKQLTLLEGDNLITITETDQAGNIGTASMHVRLNTVPPIPITDVNVSPGIISPNGDGKADTATINATAGIPCDYTITIKNSSGTPVKTFQGHSATGAISRVWDGKNGSGATQPEGTYTYYIDVTDGVSTAHTVPQAIYIDITSPQASVVAPLAGNISGTVPIKVLANDSRWRQGDWSAATLYYGQGSSPSQWIMLNRSYLPLVLDNEGQAPVLYSWDTTTLANGDYVIKWVVVDAADNVTTVNVPVTVTNAGPDIANLTVAPNPFSPDGSGTWIDLTTGEVFQDPGPNRVLDDIAAISFNVSTHSFFNIRVLDSSDNLVKQLVYSALYPDSATHKIELQWDGRNDSGALVPNGQYKLVVNGGSVQKEKSINITVDKMPFITVANIAPNPFSPDGDGTDEVTAISYNISEISYVTVEIYNQQNSLVRTLVNRELFPAGDHLHIWDGKDAQGAAIPEGRYTIKISAQAQTGNDAEPVYLNVGVLFISNIHISTDSINPYVGDTVSIIYQMAKSSVLTIKVYDPSNSPVRTLISNQSRQAGAHSEVWNGRDNANQIVNDGPYYFVIEDSASGLPQVIYDPRGTGGKDISKSINFAASNFNPLLNQFCIMNYNLPQAARINIKVRSERFSGPAIKVIRYEEPTAHGIHQATWDGRDESGNFVDMRSFTFGLWGYTLDENSVIVCGGRPVISDLNVSPVRFSPYVNPYSTNASQATVSFNLSKLADVTINIYNSKGNLVRALVTNQASAQGANAFVWDGKDNSGNLVPNDYYRIMVQAGKNGNYSETCTAHSEICY